MKYFYLSYSDNKKEYRKGKVDNDNDGHINQCATPNHFGAHCQR